MEKRIRYSASQIRTRLETLIRIRQQQLTDPDLEKIREYIEGVIKGYEYVLEEFCGKSLLTDTWRKGEKKNETNTAET